MPSAVSSSVQKAAIDWVRSRGSTASARAKARSTSSVTVAPSVRGVGRRAGVTVCSRHRARGRPSMGGAP